MHFNENIFVCESNLVLTIVSYIRIVRGQICILVLGQKTMVFRVEQFLTQVWNTNAAAKIGKAKKSLVVGCPFVSAKHFISFYKEYNFRKHTEK